MVAGSPVSLAATFPWPVTVAPTSVSLWRVEHGRQPTVPDWVDHVQPVISQPAHSPMKTRLRRRLAQGRSWVVARRHDVDPELVWALKTNRRLAHELRQAHILLLVDPAAASAFSAAPDLARGATVLSFDHMSSTGSAWIAIKSAAYTVEMLLTPDDETRAGTGAACDSQPRLRLEGVPSPLLASVQREAEVQGHRRATSVPKGQVEAVIAALQSVAEFVKSPELFQASVASLEMKLSGNVRADEYWDQVAQRALTLADDALVSGDEVLAHMRLVGAMAVILHRSRHADSLRSPLVDDPRDHLSSLNASQTLTQLRQGLPRPALAKGKAAATKERAAAKKNGAIWRVGPWRPRTVILQGAYGDFHQDLVVALGDRARVSVVPLTPKSVLRRRALEVDDVLLLAALQRGEVDVLNARWDNAPAGTDVAPMLAELQTLATHLQQCELVISDWLDPGTMWASHLVPDGTRFVIRSHSLDLLDPWLHLTDWRAVDEVLATNSAFAEVIQEMIDGLVTLTPRALPPYRPDFLEPAPERDPECRFTMGMIGWGRMVKDPQLALDLLERDPRRRLVLVGADFPHGGTDITRDYFDTFWQRARSRELSDRIDIVGYTDDVPGQLARVGIILSMSRREGCHLGLLEGAASGAVPVVRDWPLLASREGARSLCPADWVMSDLDAADSRIAAMADEALWAEHSKRARQECVQLFADPSVGHALREVLLGGEGQRSATPRRLPMRSAER